jgi:hypothetical protein
MSVSPLYTKMRRLGACIHTTEHTQRTLRHTCKTLRTHSSVPKQHTNQFIHTHGDYVGSAAVRIGVGRFGWSWVRCGAVRCGAVRCRLMGGKGE